MSTGVAGLSPLHAAYAAARPPRDRHVFTTTGRRCAACGEAAATTSYRDVVSAKFTGFHTWAPDSDQLCRACAWAYSTPALRRTAHLIATTPIPTLTPATRTEISAVLRDPLPVTAAAIVPIRGRKHLLPTASWGHVCTDDTVLRWDDAAVSLLADLRWIRALPTVTATTAGAPAPLVTVLRATDPTLWSEVLHRWDALTAWRTRPGWWDTAIALSTPTASAPRRRR